jgi:hypothetical protein
MIIRWSSTEIVLFIPVGNSRWPLPQDIVYIGPYGEISEITNPPTVVMTQW